MKVRYGDKEYEFDRRMPARKLLEELNILPETVVVVKNDEIVTEDEMLDVGDEIELVRVISGGAVRSTKPEERNGERGAGELKIFHRTDQ
ncbi:MAG: thiamine biosynthesis protein ThiS [Acidobacteria bacterium]|nr:MAG: thiamine biosynthesis protein ThiS [Acidobacteriota bacterium]